MNWRGLWIPVATALVAAVWLAPEFVNLPRVFSVGYAPMRDAPWGRQASSVVPDDRPAFQIDPTRPWRIDLGRGSARDGLKTVTLDQTGRVIIYQQTAIREKEIVVARWETAQAVLPPDAVAAVLAAVDSNRLTELHREYVAEVWDGGQWILRIRQDGHEKTVFLSNHYPDIVVRFATQLDEIIAKTAGSRLWWRPVTEADPPGPEHELWESIQR
jgi:hypothetical protein